MREFTIAAKASEDTEVQAPIEFKVGDQTCRGYLPTPGQYAILVSRTSSMRDSSESIAATIDFFLGMLDRDSARYMSLRLMDRDDPFDFEDILEISNWLIEEFAGRPTTRSTASSSSRRTGGRKSTAVVQAVESTRSASA